MASATLEMFIKIVGANKVAKSLDNISHELDEQRKQVEKNEKANAKFAAGMSSLTKLAVAGGALFAAKTLFDFGKAAVQSAVAAEEAAAAFETTFGTAAQRATKFLEGFANKAGLTVGEAQQLQATLGAVAQGIGFTQEESADLAIELTKVAADVASFSNISAGAEPVLLAFRSSLVGEREALKTYGIAITEAEVQTKAFEITTKKSVDALTRQDKALATLALIQEKAAVQIGDLDRTAQSFANQSRLVSAELRQLKEDIGDELIPVLAELLPKFRDLINDISPSLINAVSGTASAIIDLVLALDRLNDLDEGIVFLIKNFSDLADEQRFLNEISDRSIDKTNLFRIQQVALNREVIKNRTQIANQTTQLDKYTTKLTKKTLPTLEKYLTFMNLLNEENDDVIDRSKELSDAQDKVTEAQRKEALSTAEEALQKKELQKEIAELLFFQRQGADVSEELAVAQEKLRLIEFELTRESEELRDAKANLADIEAELVPKVEETTNKLAEQAEKFLELNQKVELFKELAADEEFMAIARESGEANTFLATGLGLMSGLAKLQGLENRAIELNNMAKAAERLAAAQAGMFKDVPRTQFAPPVIKPEDLLPPGYIDPGLLKALEGVGGSNIPADTVGNQTNVNKGGTQETKTVVEANFIVNDEIIQKVVTEAQQKGKVFVI